MHTDPATLLVSYERAYSGRVFDFGDWWGSDVVLLAGEAPDLPGVEIGRAERRPGILTRIDSFDPDRAGRVARWVPAYIDDAHELPGWPRLAPDPEPEHAPGFGADPLLVTIAELHAPDGAWRVLDNAAWRVLDNAAAHTDQPRPAFGPVWVRVNGDGPIALVAATGPIAGRI